MAAGQPAKARRVLRSVVQSAEADPLSLLLAAKAAVATGGDAVSDGVALARCRSLLLGGLNKHAFRGRVPLAVALLAPRPAFPEWQVPPR